MDIRDLVEGDIVRIPEYPKDSINAYGRVVVVENDRYYVSNMNMPFSGTLACVPFLEGELERT